MCRPLILLVTLLVTTQVHARPQDLLSLYQHLHANPELSFQEVNTSALMARELEAAGFEVTRGVGGEGVRESLKQGGAVLNKKVGGHGVVGLLRNGKGPVLMLRTDMDALPVEEQTGLAYASTARGVELTGQEVSVMHACGHDTHMTVVIGVARALAKRQQDWSGTLMVIAQPAEERGAGARMMLADGLFERFPRPDFNLSLHGMPTLPAGTVGYVSGWMMANVDSVDITVHGIGAHGAYPQAGKDPIVLAAAIIMDLQTLVSREINPLQPAVVTVGSIHAGTKHNIISDRAHLQLTVRSYSEAVRQKLLAGIERIAINQARAFGLPEDKLPEVVVGDEYTPALWNDPALVARTVAVFKRAIGDDNVIEVDRVMGGEDFSRYGRVEPRIPSFMVRLGSVPREKYAASQRGELDLPSLHSPFYYPEPELTITTGVKAMTAAVLELLN
ncbi:MAG: amidohydrolase [Gammaproteobacteria bacterium]|nr:amidohydrolase [Gammaproteobacteria bacterium]